MSSALLSLETAFQSKLCFNNEILMASVHFDSDNLKEADVEVFQKIYRSGKFNGDDLKEIELKNLKLYGTTKIFEKKIQGLLLQVEHCLYEKVDSPVANNLRSEYLAEHIQRLFEVMNKIHQIRKQFTPDSEQTEFLENHEEAAIVLPMPVEILDVEDLANWGLKFYEAMSRINLDTRTFLQKSKETHLAEILDHCSNLVFLSASRLLNRFSLLEKYNLIEDQGLFKLTLNNNNLYKRPKKNLPREEDLPKTFEDLFLDKAHEEVVKRLLHEQGLYNPTASLWIDEGNGKNGYLIAVLKKLHKEGYFKRKLKLTPELLKSIVENSFGIQMAVSTIRRIKCDKPGLDFIPRIDNKKLTTQ